MPLPALIDVNYNIPWGADDTADYKIKYYLNGTYLERQILDSSDSVVSQKRMTANVTDLQFALVSSRSIKIVIDFQRSLSIVRTVNYTVSNVVYLSN